MVFGLSTAMVALTSLVLASGTIDEQKSKDGAKAKAESTPRALAANKADGVSQQTWTFTVFRDGEEIGQESFDFQLQNDKKLKVSVKTRTMVTRLAIPFYRYEHDREEIWDSNQLVSLTSKTHDNGPEYTLIAKKEGEGYKIQSNDTERQSDAAELPVTFWNEDILRTSKLFSALHGKPMNVQIVKKEPTTLQIANATIPATHYVMKGDLERELWYNEQGKLLKVSFMKDGSHIEFILKP